MVVDSTTLLRRGSKMQMEGVQAKEWTDAQMIEVSIDLVAAAKRQLKFLETINNYPCLFEGPILERAIYRYNVFWLPMLAKHFEYSLIEEPLVVPLDCEWVWHCHRLNPVQYAFDCKRLYGKILDNTNVVSSVDGACKRQTEMAWAKLYPEECYEMDFNVASIEDVAKKIAEHGNCTNYDLVSAVKRQSTFFTKLNNCYIWDDGFIVEAIARYKGFLHLLRKEKEKSIVCIPTLDIDLIWHTHQLHPVAYCKDIMMLLNKVLQHDDTFSDESKGQHDVGFSQAKAHWEKTFGTKYLRGCATPRHKKSKLLGSEEASRCKSLFEYVDGFAGGEEASRCKCLFENADGFDGSEDASRCKSLFKYVDGFARGKEASQCKCLFECADGFVGCKEASRCLCFFKYANEFARSKKANQSKCLFENADGFDGGEEASKCKRLFECADGFTGSEEASRCMCLFENADGFDGGEEASKCKCSFEYADGLAGSEEASRCMCLFEHAHPNEVTLSIEVPTHA